MQNAINDDAYHAAIDAMVRSDGLEKVLTMPGVWEAICAYYDAEEIDRQMAIIGGGLSDERR